MVARWDSEGEHEADYDVPEYLKSFRGSRPVEDVPLPGDAVPSRHALYRAGDRSACPWHYGQCAYTGAEPDRCPVCHALWTTVLADIRTAHDYHAGHLAGHLVTDLDPERRQLIRSMAERAKRSSGR